MESELREQIELDLTREVVGRLQNPRFHAFWEKVIKPSNLTLKILREGFKDGESPQPARLPNNKSAISNGLFV